MIALLFTITVTLAVAAVYATKGSAYDLFLIRQAKLHCEALNASLAKYSH